MPTGIYIHKKGRKHTPEAILKIKEARSMQIITLEHRKSISEAQKRIGNKPPSNLGKKHSIETRIKISEGNMGNKNWLGKKHSEESKKKIGLAHSGEKCTFWKGGTSSLIDILRHTKMYNSWRTRVFQRDQYTCVDCGKLGGKLQADHIIPFSFLIKKYQIKSKKVAMKVKELWKINNGRTMCRPCHFKTPTYGSKAINYKLSY